MEEASWLLGDSSRHSNKSKKLHEVKDERLKNSFISQTRPDGPSASRPRVNMGWGGGLGSSDQLQNFKSPPRHCPHLAIYNTIEGRNLITQRRQTSNATHTTS